MKIKLIKLTLLLLAFSSCNKQNVTENSSEQIKTEIAKVSKNSEENTEIECPECHNIIELDWNEEECGGCCSGCDGCEEGHDNEHDEDNNDEDM